jgi:signal transduction histidine kinase
MNRLAVRIFLAFFAALLLSALGAIVLTAWVINQRQQAAETELLEAAQSAADALAEGGRAELQVWARNRATTPGTSLEILIIDESGRELLGRPLPPAPPPALPPAILEAETGSEYYWEDLPAVLLNLPKASPELVSTEGESFRLRAAPQRTGLAAWRDVPLQWLLLALAVTLSTSLLLARSITRPVLALQRTTEALAAGALATRVPGPARARTDEIGRLARSLDSMAERLDSLIRGQQQLLRDVSHEVRSPLTRIRLASGLLAQRDPASAAAVARIDDEVSRLDELIDKILDVSRLESGAVRWQREPLDLHALVGSILADAAFEASRLGKTLVADIGEIPVPIEGDRHWVLAAIENVVRNALKHTPENSRVTVRLKYRGDTALLQVSDTGHGLDDDELRRVFEPFYRGTRHDGDTAAPHAAGSGLGLAIAARVLQGHGGRIEARNLRDPAGAVSGLEISLEWPLAARQAQDPRTAAAP